jgi:hypothetical protein
MQRIHLFAALLLFLGLPACQPKLGFPAHSDNNKNLNSLLTLNIGNNTVYIQDFILNPTDVDSITSSSTELRFNIAADKKTVNIIASPKMETFADVKLWVKGTPYSIPCRRTDKIDYTFTFDPHGAPYEKVQIAGQMNDWTASATPDLKLTAKVCTK